MMDSSLNINIPQAEYPNGLLLICASGLGNALNIPNDWPEEQLSVTTENAVFIDMSTVFDSDNRIFDVEVLRGQELGQNVTMIGKFEIDLPKEKIYIGNIIRDGRVIDLHTKKCTFSVAAVDDYQNNQKLLIRIY